MRPTSTPSGESTTSRASRPSCSRLSRSSVPPRIPERVRSCTVPVMRGSRIVVSVVALAALAADASALEVGRSLSQYSHAVWQEKDGLPSDMVNAVLQTRDGYVWFGTLNGLARFDGVRVTAYDPMNSDAPLLH